MSSGSSASLSEVTVQPASGRSLLFVCPAYQRVELASICYRQFAEVKETCAGFGLKTEFLILSDDENWDAAADAGLDAVQVANRLGQRLNEGYQRAAEEDYDYVCAIGNDSFVHPDRFQWLPVGDAILCTRNFTCLNSEANQQAALRLDYPGGVGTRVFPIGMLERVNYKPITDPYQMSGCDTETLLALCRGVQKAPDLIYTDMHPAEIVGFQSGDVQVTKWAWWLQHPHTVQEPFEGLVELYGAGLVDEVRAHYSVAV